jgi:hypothetical protein
MPYTMKDIVMGAGPLADTETVLGTIPLGTVVKGHDPVYGEGEFIRLRGVASTAIGDAVVWDNAFQTTRAVAASRGAVGVALSANVANQFGWYQISGLAAAKAGTVVNNTAAQLSGTPGTLDDTTTAGQFVDGAVFKSADGTPAAGFAILQMSRPSANGR